MGEKENGRPLVVGFDHNVTHALIRPENRERAFAARRRVEAGEIEFVATQELIEEAAGVVETNDPGRFGLFGGAIGSLTQGRHLATLEWVVQTELLGRAEPFASEEDRAILLGLLQGAANGGAAIEGARGIAREARRKRLEAATRWRELNLPLRDSVRNAPGPARRGVHALTFEDVDRVNWTKWGRSTILQKAVEAGAPNAEEIADRVMAAPESFRFTRRYMQVFSVLRWWWTVRQRRVDEGDQNDARQLVLFPAMDHFVTNDGPIREWSLALGDPVGKVVTFEEFLSSPGAITEGDHAEA